MMGAVLGRFSERLGIGFSGDSGVCPEDLEEQLIDMSAANGRQKKRGASWIKIELEGRPEHC